MFGAVLLVRAAASALMVSGLVMTSCPALAHADDQDDRFAELLEQNYGITIDSGAAAAMAAAACDGPMMGVGLYNLQREMQQRYSLGIGTVASVMSAGILAYCPERLG